MSVSWSLRKLTRRWLKFNAVGAMGICVQLLAVYLFGTVLAINFLCATALAVEAAVLHNFFWHQHFTWRERRIVARNAILRRLFAFNATTGAMAIAGNLFLVSLLIREFRAPLLGANSLAVGACSFANFGVSNTVIFRGRTPSKFNTAFQTRTARFSSADFHGTLSLGAFRHHEPDRADPKRLDRGDEGKG